jgi:repressor LexA
MSVLKEKYSKRQLELREQVLRATVDLVNSRPYPPSYRDILQETSVKSLCTIHRYLNEFQDLGLLNLGESSEPSRARSPKSQTGAKSRQPNRSISLNWEALSQMGLRPPHSVPVLGQIVAGEPIQAESGDSANIQGWVRVSKDIPHAMDDLIALRVKGDSMKDACVLDGDIVVLRPTDQYNKKDMYAIWLEGDGETTLKYITVKGENAHLVPANPDYREVVRPLEQVHVHWKVIEIIRLPGDSTRL